MTQIEILPVLRERNSSIAFDPSKTVSEDDMQALLEAARWAPSGSNGQPWRWMIARRGTPEFDGIWNVLMPGNQGWTKFAPVLMIAAAQTSYTRPDGTKQLNRTAFYDAGLANMSLAAEATRRGLNLRMMGGFKLDEARKLMPEGVEPICVIALGATNDGSHLPEDMRARISAPRQRKSISEFVIA